MIISKELKGYKSVIEEIVKDLHSLTVKIGNKDLTNTVSDLRNRISEPFMFVIVGEVKAGKSSFINALLETDKEICKVSPAPMTDTIQQIMYGETEAITVVNPYLKQVFQPVEILKEIAIVDTPGTNTIVANHQQITEDFIPACDLVVFVFESKNPYRQSAWDFFDFIHADWRKKIVFVMQQKDLMPEHDLAINIQGVRDYAEKKGLLNPNIFAVSAKQELEGQKAESGFTAIRAYIADNITGGKSPKLKLLNNIQTSHNINEKIEKGLDERAEQYSEDNLFRADIRQTLDNQEIKSNKQVDILKENILASYDKITRRTENELSEGLAFSTIIKRSISSFFNKDNGAKEWLITISDKMKTDLNKEMHDRLLNGINDLSDSIQQMAKIIDLKIRASKTILKHDHEIFSDIAERRANVLKELQDTFQKFMSSSENFNDSNIFSDKGKSIAPNIATGGGIAIIGMVIAALTNGVVLDVTGGVLTGVGLLFAGVTVVLQKGKIMNAFHQEIEKGRNQLEENLDEKLKAYVHAIKNKIDANFAIFDDMLQKENLQIQDLRDQQRDIEDRLKTVDGELR